MADESKGLELIVRARNEVGVSMTRLNADLEKMQAETYRLNHSARETERHDVDLHFEGLRARHESQQKLLTEITKKSADERAAIETRARTLGRPYSTGEEEQLGKLAKRGEQIAAMETKLGEVRAAAAEKETAQRRVQADKESEQDTERLVAAEKYADAESASQERYVREQMDRIGEVREAEAAEWNNRLVDADKFAQAERETAERTKADKVRLAGEMYDATHTARQNEIRSAMEHFSQMKQLHLEDGEWRTKVAEAARAKVAQINKRYDEQEEGGGAVMRGLMRAATRILGVTTAVRVGIGTAGYLMGVSETARNLQDSGGGDSLRLILQQRQAARQVAWQIPIVGFTIAQLMKNMSDDYSVEKLAKGVDTSARASAGAREYAAQRTSGAGRAALEAQGAGALELRFADQAAAVRNQALKRHALAREAEDAAKTARDADERVGKAWDSMYRFGYQRNAATNEYVASVTARVEAGASAHTAMLALNEARIADAKESAEKQTILERDLEDARTTYTKSGVTVRIAEEEKAANQLIRILRERNQSVVGIEAELARRVRAIREEEQTNYKLQTLAAQAPTRSIVEQQRRDWEELITRQKLDPGLKDNPAATASLHEKQQDAMRATWAMQKEDVAHALDYERKIADMTGGAAVAEARAREVEALKESFREKERAYQDDAWMMARIVETRDAQERARTRQWAREDAEFARDQATQRFMLENMGESMESAKRREHKAAYEAYSAEWKTADPARRRELEQTYFAGEKERNARFGRQETDRSGSLLVESLRMAGRGAEAEALERRMQFEASLRGTEDPAEQAMLRARFGYQEAAQAGRGQGRYETATSASRFLTHTPGYTDPMMAAGGVMRKAADDFLKAVEAFAKAKGITIEKVETFRGRS